MHGDADVAEDVRQGMGNGGGESCAKEAAGSWDEADGSDEAEGAEGLRGLLKRILEELKTNPHRAVSPTFACLASPVRLPTDFASHANVSSSSRPSAFLV